MPSTTRGALLVVEILGMPRISVGWPTELCRAE
jgi:hypothetical protein